MPGNDILLSLPATELTELSKRLKRVDLRFHQILFAVGQQIDSVWFPETCIVSLVLELPEGREIECGTVGREGVIGLGGAICRGNSYSRQWVQVAGSALQLGRLDLLRCMQDLPTFRDHIHRSQDHLTAHCMQMAACLAVHSTRERVARTVLELSDRTQEYEIQITHETLALTVGASRQTTTSILSSLERRGAIRKRRNRLLILDRGLMAALACSCYRVALSRYTEAFWSNS